MGKVKNAFATQMVPSSELHFNNAAKEPTSADIQVSKACCLYPWMNIFQEEGWAIPKQVSFQYFCTFFTPFFFQALLNPCYLKNVLIYGFFSMLLLKSSG